jgi:hypothetical protein
MTTRFDRRRFLFGAGGALLSMPMLESLIPSKAYGGTAAPKRLVVIRHNHGRMIGNGVPGNGPIQDRWSPGSVTGPLAAGISPQLAPLDVVRNEIVTLDGIDNRVRHLGTSPHGTDGHYYPTLTSLTCVLPKADGTAGGPSIDYVAGNRLKANAAMPASIVIDADSGNAAEGGNFWGANGTAPNAVNFDDGSPTTAIGKIFTNVSSTPPPTPTLKDRLTGGRGSILSRVHQDYSSLRSKVSTRDQARLDQHMQFLSDAQARYGTASMSMPSSGCHPLTAADVPSTVEQYSYSAANDNLSVPIIMDTIVQTLLCDVTRAVGCDFASDVPTFDWMFPGGSPFNSTVWHAQIHGSDQLGNPEVTNVQPTFSFYSQMVSLLIQKLAAATDVDGSRLLDNTLVVWVSDLGYGPTHACFNYPVVLAGLKSAFPKGQGRHVVMGNRASLGDLYAHVLRMLGGTDMTFGVTGTLQSAAGTANLACDDTSFCSDYGYPGAITPSTPLHSGPLDL